MKINTLWLHERGLQLSAHIKYSCQLLYSLKRSMTLDLSGLWGREDYGLDTRTAIVWSENKASCVVFGVSVTFADLWPCLKMAVRKVTSEHGGKFVGIWFFAMIIDVLIHLIHFYQTKTHFCCV